MSALNIVMVFCDNVLCRIQSAKVINIVKVFCDNVLCRIQSAKVTDRRI